jgi:hypothetical protein
LGTHVLPQLVAQPEVPSRGGLEQRHICESVLRCGATDHVVPVGIARGTLNMNLTADHGQSAS